MGREANEGTIQARRAEQNRRAGPFIQANKANTDDLQSEDNQGCQHCSLHQPSSAISTTDRKASRREGGGNSEHSVRRWQPCPHTLLALCTGKGRTYCQESLSGQVVLKSQSSLRSSSVLLKPNNEEHGHLQKQAACQPRRSTLPLGRKQCSPSTETWGHWLLLVHRSSLGPDNKQKNQRILQLFQLFF